MKRIFFLVFFLCFLLSGCFCAPVEITYSPPEEYAETNYEDMEIYQFLRENITEDSSLEEMLDVFAQMSRIPVDSSTDMYLYEVHSYEFEGAEYVYCHIVRQVDEPGSDEFIQLSLDVTYLYDEDMAGFDEVTWFERDASGFVSYIQNGSIYQTLIDKPIYATYVSISST